jgi:hypothetical protein
MENPGTPAARPNDMDTTSKWLMVTFGLGGLLLIMISIALSHRGFSGYWSELTKELGIVVLAVFTVSFLYERLVAEKYFEHFLAQLRGQLQQGESNAAACAQLGIIEIFPTRDVFEMKYPIAGWTSSLAAGSSFRIVAQSLFLLMGKVETIKAAIARGADVEFCVTDPTSTGPTVRAERISGLEVSDIMSAVSVFKKQIADWTRVAKPPGSVELRYHQLPLIDSYMVLRSPTVQVAAWDLSFGRATTSKRIFLLDLEKPLSVDLSGRYGRVWDDSLASTVFRYQRGEVHVDNLTPVAPIALL